MGDGAESAQATRCWRPVTFHDERCSSALPSDCGYVPTTIITLLSRRPERRLRLVGRIDLPAIWAMGRPARPGFFILIQCGDRSDS